MSPLTPLSFDRAFVCLMTNARSTPRFRPKSSTAETGGADPFAAQAVTPFPSVSS